MALKFLAGAKVRQVLPPPVEGEVVRFVFDETSGTISYIVRDAEGVERSFSEENLEAQG